MPDVSAPFIRLGDDGDDAPRLSYSIPESTNHVGLSVICVDVDQSDLNSETLAQLRENVEAKHGERPHPVPPDLRVTDFAVVPKGPRMATVNSFRAVAEIYEENPSNFIYAPAEGMLGFTGDFDIILPRPHPPGRVFPKILFFEKLQISTFLGNYGAGRSSRPSRSFPGRRRRSRSRRTRRPSRPRRRRSTSAHPCSTP